MKNPKRKKEYKQDWNKRNPIRMQEYMEKFLEKHPNYTKKYYQEHKEQIKQCTKKHYEKNKGKKIKYVKEWLEKNKDKRREWNRKYKTQKRKEDVNYKILCYLRSRLYKALKNNNKSKSTIKLLGCTIPELKKHLEKQFKKGMTWENYGKWHIDHIKPCALFDLSKLEEQYNCFHYSNLQPLWAGENLKKNKKLKKCF